MSDDDDLLTRLDQIRYFSKPLHESAATRIRLLDSQLLECHEKRLSETIRDLPEVMKAFADAEKLVTLKGAIEDVDGAFGGLRTSFEGDEIDALFTALENCDAE